MSDTIGIIEKHGETAHMFNRQPPSILNQPAPVQNTWYEVGTYTNAEIISIGTTIEDTDETLECQVTINGAVITPISALAATHSTNYEWFIMEYSTVPGVYLKSQVSGTAKYTKNVLVTARTIKVEMRKTTAAGAGNLVGLVIWGQLS